MPFEYNVGLPFTEGVASVKKGSKWGFIDKKGKVVIPFQYSHTASFKNGLAYVEKDNKEFYINKKGEIIKEDK